MPVNHPTLKKFIHDTNSRLLFIGKAGSKLYGTDTPTSDTDYKGIFMPSEVSLLLQQAPENFTFTSGDNNSANTAEDLDLDLFSFHKWVRLLAKGDTGATETLFSILTSGAVEYLDPVFETFIKNNFSNLITNNPYSWIGFALGQAKKYEIKGARYKELHELEQLLLKLNAEDRLVTHMTYFKDLVVKYKYINIQNLSGSRDGSRNLDYLDILGKKFSEEVTVQYVLNHVSQRVKTFGQRAKAATGDVEWKGMSHAVRVVLQCQVLMATEVIGFPLKDKKFIKAIKAGSVPLEEVMNLLDTTLDTIYHMRDNEPQRKLNTTLTNQFILEFIKDHSWLNNKCTLSEELLETDLKV